MLQLKIFNKKENREDKFNNSIKNIISYISENLNFPKVKIASDSDCIEIISGNTGNSNVDDKIVVELSIKKIIILSKNDVSVDNKLDKFIQDIKFFCKQAKEIEDNKYIPFYLKREE